MQIFHHPDRFEGRMKPPISLCQALPCTMLSDIHIVSESSEAWSTQLAKVDSKTSLRQPHPKHRGNAADETLPQRIKYRFGHLVFTSAKHPWAAVARYLCSTEPDHDKLQRRLDPSIPSGLFLLAEMWSCFKQKRGEENSVKVRKVVEDSQNSDTVKFLLFLSLWQHLSQTHSAYTLCGENLVCILATCPQQVQPTLTEQKESNKSMDLQPTKKGVLCFSSHRLPAIATSFLNFSISSQEDNAVTSQSSHKIVK